MDQRLLLMTGSDYPIPECNLVLHQPTIYEIGLIGEEVFFTGIQTLSLNKSMFQQGESLLSDISNFQIFMTIMTNPEMVDKKVVVEQILTLLLPNKKPSFTPQSLLLVGKDGISTIDENNFENLQEAIRTIFCLNNGPMDQTIFDPVDSQAKKIAEKIMQGRAKIAAEKGKNQGSVYGQYISILSIGLHLALTDLVKYTVYQLYDSIERFGLFIDWDIDIKTRLAGGKPDKQSENWMKNIH